MTKPPGTQGSSWLNKFRCAVRGVVWAMVSERSFSVHLAAVAAVLVFGIALDMGWPDWCLLTLCIALVLSAEMFNTALEKMAQSITDQPDSRVRDALDAASGAVLIAALGAAIVGGLVFLHRLGLVMEWWTV